MHLVIALVVLLVSSTALPAQASVLYGSDLSTGNLGTIDRMTGAFTPIGSHGISGPMTGLAWHPVTDVLYGVSPGNNSLYSIDQATGAATLIGPTGFSNVNTLAYHPGSGLMYATDLNGRAFFTIDLTTGAGTLVGTYPSGMSIEGLAIDPATGTIYGLEDNADGIVVIDPLTAAATPLPSSIGISGIARGLDFDFEQNVILESIVNPGRLVRIDPATGAGTLVGSLPTFIQGIAFKGPLGMSAQYQQNQLQAAIEINGIQATPSMPAVVSLGLSQVGQASATSILTGQAFDFGFGMAPLVPVNQGALVTGDGQILNLDLADPTLFLVFGGFQSPPFMNLAAPISSPVPLTTSIQMAVLDPAAASGVRFSQAVRLIIN